MVADAVRTELLEASDEFIDEAVKSADPMALRGLLYQLTGDETVAAVPVVRVPSYVGGDLARGITDPESIAFLQAKAAEFLKSYRDSGAGPIGPGPAERLPRSLALAGGMDALPEGDEELWVEEFAHDPWVRGLTWPDATPPPPEQLAGFHVVVIGSGIGGLNAAAQLQHSGIPYTVLEKNPSVGGTWYENHYPGARVDTPSRGYSPIIGVTFPCPAPWRSRAENQEYFNWMADHYGVREHIVFNTEVTTLTWDEAAAQWEVEAKGPEGRRVYRADAVITAVGLLSRPSLPQIPGMDEFTGLSFHTAQWPEELDPAGKRFAVIGTGCSGLQLVPELALLAEHVDVYQRTPQWLFEHKGYRDPFPDAIQWLDRNFPYHANMVRFRAQWALGPYLSGPLREIDPDYHDDPYAVSAVSKQIREERIAFIERKFAAHPQLIEKMIPPHPPFSARPAQVDVDYNFYDAVQREDVTLVTEGIEQITPRGIRTVDGVEHEVDVIVYATGFKANEVLWPMHVIGRGSRTVEELWVKDGPRAYLGTMLPGFPNLFMVYGPNMNPYGGLGVINHQEFAARLLLECVGELATGRARTVEVTEAAYWDWNDRLDERETYKIYKDSRAVTYYKNEQGRSAVNCPFPGNEMFHFMRHVNREDVIFRSS